MEDHGGSAPVNSQRRQANILFERLGSSAYGRGCEKGNAPGPSLYEETWQLKWIVFLHFGKLVGAEIPSDREIDGRTCPGSSFFLKMAIVKETLFYTTCSSDQRGFSRRRLEDQAPLVAMLEARGNESCWGPTILYLLNLKNDAGWKRQTLPKKTRKVARWCGAMDLAVKQLGLTGKQSGTKSALTNSHFESWIRTSSRR